MTSRYRTIVPYRGSRTMVPFRVRRFISPRMRMAAAAAQSAYSVASDPRVQKASKKIFNFIKTKLKKKPQISKRLPTGDGVGFAIRNTGCIRSALEAEGESPDSKYLQVYDLTDFDRGSLNPEVVNVAGIKLCFNLHNISGEADTNVYVNIAILRPRNTQSITGVEFFRGIGNIRGTDFTDTLNGLQLHCLPINEDKFEIFMHKRLMLGKDYGDTNHPPFQTIEDYLPLKRQLRFDNQSNFAQCTTPIYFCIWHSGVLSQSTDPQGNSLITLNYNHIVYWRNAGVF